MKKFLSLTLAICILCGAMTLCANAAYMDDANHVTDDTAGNSDTAGVVAGNPGDTIGSVDIPVNIETNRDTNVTNVYAISHDVTELAFVYNFTEDRIWNPETLKYEIVVEGDWADASQDITITNYSDVPVNVTPSYSTPAVEGVTVTLSAALELASAYDNNLSQAGTAKTGVISVTLGGDPVADLENATLLTTVTLAITDAR